MKAPLVLLVALFITSAHQTLLGATSGDWTYSVSGSQATITGYSGAGGAVEIPAVVDGNPVIKVGNDRITSIFGDGNTTVTSVTIPDNVTSIGDDAFYNCSSLTSVTIGNSVTSIGVAAFRSCSSLTSVNIPDSVTSIAEYAFFGCTSLASATIGNSVTSIKRDAFRSCTSLASVTIGNSVTSIGMTAFAYCTSLTSISIPDSVTSIGDYAFYYCTNLTSVTLPILFKDSYSSFSLSSDQVLLYGVGTSGDWTYSALDSQATITGYSGVGGAVEIPAVVDGISVVKVGDDSSQIFGSGNTTVTSVTIPDSVTSIADLAFSYCTSLASITVDTGNLNYSSVDGRLFNKLQTFLIQYPAGILDDSYTIPDSVTSIVNYAFADCTSLTSITIPDSVTSIASGAFYACTSLTGVTIPDSVTSIVNYAFSDCTSLASVTIPDSVTSIGEYAFYGCASLASITIPDNVTSVGESAFRSCTSLSSITIGNSVTSIGVYAFSNCTSLTSVTLPILFKDSYSSFSLSSDQVLLYGSPNARDVPLSNNLAAGRTLGRSDVTSDPSSYSLYTSSDVSTAEASARTAGRSDVTSDPATYNLYTASDVSTAETSARTAGRSDVTSDPSSYSLYTATDVSTARTAGRSDVTSDPSSYSLYTASDVSTAEAAARTAGQTDVTSDPATYSLYTVGDVSAAEAASRTLGQQDVTASPSVYDLHTSTELAEATAAARTIVNVSARMNIGAGETVIPGFVVLGKSKQLLIRAVGPKLADLGVPSPLPDPTMTIYRTRYDGQPNEIVAIINDWKADGADVTAINAAMATVGAFPLEPTETFQGRPFMTDDTSSAAALITLSVGVYTVVVTSADGGQGDVLVEAYEIY